MRQGREFLVKDRCQVPNTYLLGQYSFLTNLTRNEGEWSVSRNCKHLNYHIIESVSASKVHFSFLSNAGRFYLGGTFIKPQVKLLLLSPVTQLCSGTDDFARGTVHTPATFWVQTPPQHYRCQCSRKAQSHGLPNGITHLIFSN